MWRWVRYTAATDLKELFTPWLRIVLVICPSWLAIHPFLCPRRLSSLDYSNGFCCSLSSDWLVQWVGGLAGSQWTESGEKLENIYPLGSSPPWLPMPAASLNLQPRLLASSTLHTFLSSYFYTHHPALMLFGWDGSPLLWPDQDIALSIKVPSPWSYPLENSSCIRSSTNLQFSCPAVTDTRTFAYLLCDPGKVI